MGCTSWAWLPMMMSTPASASCLAYFFWLLSGSRTYSLPQWGQAMITSAPASRSFFTSALKSALLM